jgi:hypothetical protein
MKRNNAALIVGAFVLTSCQSWGDPRTHSDYPSLQGAKIWRPAKGTKLVLDEKFRPAIGRFKNKVWDLQGGVLDGRLLGPCTNREGGPTLVVKLDGVTIQNGALIHLPDGIRLHGKKQTLRRLKLWNGEDSISLVHDASDWRIIECDFRPSSRKRPPGGDKAIQANSTRGKNYIMRCRFEGFLTAVQGGLHAQDEKPGHIYARQNEFYYVGTAYKAVTAHLHVSGEQIYEKTRRPYQIENGQITSE